MSDYHNRMMNIQVDAASMAEAGKPRSLRLAYKYGHRDARHAAAEIALEAQAEIARLREVLSVIAYPLNISKIYHVDAVTQARAALATVEGVGK